MEYEQDDQNQEGGFMQRVKESPRTVSALIIILIVAAAIYAFSGDQNQEPGDLASNDQAATTEEQGEPTEEAGEETQEGEDAATEEGATTTPTQATPEPVDRETLAEENEALPEASKTDQGYVEVAAAGEGVTHLARKATTRYLSENNVDFDVTNEHRIYIEDYIKDRMGSNGLSLGESQTISFDLLKEAVDSARNLTPAQLNNLSQYTSALN